MVLNRYLLFLCSFLAEIAYFYSFQIFSASIRFSLSRFSRLTNYYEFLQRNCSLPVGNWLIHERTVGLARWSTVLQKC